MQIRACRLSGAEGANRQSAILEFVIWNVGFKTFSRNENRK